MNLTQILLKAKKRGPWFVDTKGRIRNQFGECPAQALPGDSSMEDVRLQEENGYKGNVNAFLLAADKTPWEDGYVKPESNKEVDMRKVNPNTVRRIRGAMMRILKPRKRA